MDKWSMCYFFLALDCSLPIISALDGNWKARQVQIEIRQPVWDEDGFQPDQCCEPDFLCRSKFWFILFGFLVYLIAPTMLIYAIVTTDPSSSFNSS
jgi:hypothetical protein